MREQIIFNTSPALFNESLDSNKWFYSAKIGFLFGFLGKSLANVLNKKPALANPGYHVLWTAAFCGVGSVVWHFKVAELQKVERLRDKLVMQRMKRLHKQEA